ncbi:hypothetical protein ASD02_34480 [Ensifer sp. Root1252]|nr:hypothetical protein ASD02_34480 [Ensifer sp. Root1252]KRC68765.1 hypothetical protein ASE32_35310 [Ensifer sp. Root231]KRC93931.1 hypothetical protein ASE47_34975 [Ensifer sp. Root258]
MNYCLSIGVRKSGKLPELPSAVPDAQKFAAWAEACRDKYRTTLLTDEHEPVTIAGIKAVIRAIVEEFPQRLIIYYSGHGIYSQVGDQWLLSEFDRDGNEAVNLTPSMRNARRLGIGQVAIFSDACRSSIATAGLVDGSNIFPLPTTGKAPVAPFDEFFSTDLGRPAQEIDGDGSAGYGIFTKCLLEALSGLDPGAAEVRDEKLVVSSEALATRLEKRVPYESGLISNAAVQYPSITPSWRRPNDTYAELRRSTATKTRGGFLSLGVGHKDPEVMLQEAMARQRVSAGRADREELIEERTRAFALANKMNAPADILQGFRVIGQDVRRIVPEDVASKSENNPSYFNIISNATTVAVQTVDNQWIGLPIFPYFVATVVVGEEGVENISYAPSKSLGRWSDPKVQDVISEWNALLSVERTPDRGRLGKFADRMRHFKHDNPALGILAAYAYERAGMIDELASVAWYLANRNQFVPYDLILLLEAYGESRQLIESIGETDEYKVIGKFPMLTRGWSMIDYSEAKETSHLLNLRRGLRNSVWTSFDARAGKRLATIIGD